MRDQPAACPVSGWPDLPDTVFASARHAELPSLGVTAGPARRRRAFDHLAGRLAASRALLALTGHAPGIGRDASGAPLWPQGVVGAISHSDGRAVALVGQAAHHAGLGVDLETIAPRDRMAELILRPDELASLGQAPGAFGLTLAFSAKESLFKALYPRVGHIFGFDAAALLSVGMGTGQLCLRQALGPWDKETTFRFHWTETEGQVLTALSAQAPARAPQARRVAPPST